MIEDVRSFGEQRVRMVGLGGASSGCRAVGQNVSLDHRDSGEGIGQDSGGQQSADGSTENHGLPTDCPHETPIALTQRRPCRVRACGESISGRT